MTDKKIWSKNWDNFDWSIVQKKLTIATQSPTSIENENTIDIGITSEEFKEFFKWLFSTNPDEFFKTIAYLQLRKIGAANDEAEFLLSHPEELNQLLACTIEDLKKRDKE